MGRVKRRIGLRTLERLNLSGVAELLEGSVGFVLTADANDVSLVAKELIEFIKSHENQLTVRGAWIDGQLCDTQWVETLASLPRKSVLLAEVVGTVELPLVDLLSTIERLMGDVAGLVEQIAMKKPATPAPAEQKATSAPQKSSE